MQSGPPFPFQPSASNQNPPASQVAAAISAGVIQLNLPAAPYDAETTMKVVVDGTANISFCFGVAAGLTIANGCFQLANTSEIYLVPPGVTQMSVIGSASAGNIRVIIGHGV